MEGGDQVGLAQVPGEDALGPGEQGLDVGGLQLRHPGGEGVVGHDDEGHGVAVAPGALHLAGQQGPERPEIRRLGGSGAGLRQEDRLVVAVRIEALVALGHLGRAPHETGLPSQLGEGEHVADAAEHRALLQWPLEARLGAGPERAAVGVPFLGGVDQDDGEVRVAGLQGRADRLGVEAVGLGGDEEVGPEAPHRLEGLVLVPRSAHLVPGFQETPESAGNGRTRISDDDAAHA